MSDLLIGLNFKNKIHNSKKLLKAYLLNHSSNPTILDHKMISIKLQMVSISWHIVNIQDRILFLDLSEKIQDRNKWRKWLEVFPVNCNKEDFHMMIEYSMMKKRRRIKCRLQVPAEQQEKEVQYKKSKTKIASESVVYKVQLYQKVQVLCPFQYNKQLNNNNSLQE